MTALVIAAHGTRIAAGQQATRELVDLVRQKLAGTKVYDCYVELDQPTISEAVAQALAEDADHQAIVVPLMLGTGSHVQDDIPEGISAGKNHGGEVIYTKHLGPHQLLKDAVAQRIYAAAGDWDLAEISLVFLGRGTSQTVPNADHVRLGRVLAETIGFKDVVTGFIQVATPNLATALDQAWSHGGRKIVVMPHFLFPGRLENWTHEQADAWQDAHPDAEVRVAGVIGVCDELADVVVERYRNAAASSPQIYLSGLNLAGRKVVVAGGGRVTDRRIQKLLDAKANVEVIAPQASELIQRLAKQGRLLWRQAEIVEADLDGAWYVLAQTDNPNVNEQICVWAEDRRIFCVRADYKAGGSAWTPATGSTTGLTLGVLAGGDPHRAARARTAAVHALEGLR